MTEQFRKKILVVDDDEDILLLLKDIFTLAGYEVISTNEGKTAIKLAHEFLPDLIIMDIIMPGMRGEEVVSILAQNPSTRKIPVIFLTGILEKEEEERIKRKTGRYCLLAKPITEKEILEAVEKYLSE